MSTTTIIREIADALRSASTVLISAHRNPDGDTLGCQLGLMHALEALGKKVTAHNLDPVPEIYRFLPGSNRILHGKDVQGHYDAFVVVDADPPRTGLFSHEYPADVLINIDHHVTNPCVWPLTWLDADAAACGMMIHRLVRELSTPITRDIAICLYTSIFTDTGSFRYTNTSPESMRVSAELLEAGADPWMVTEHVYESFAFRRIKLLGLVLGSMERSPDGRIGWVVVTDELYQLTGTTAEDTDNFVNFARATKGVEVAVLFRQTAAAEYKISMRSKGRVNLSSLAQAFGGGGHANAAGGVLQGTFVEVKERVMAGVAQIIREQLGPAKDQHA